MGGLVKWFQKTPHGFKLFNTVGVLSQRPGRGHGEVLNICTRLGNLHAEYDKDGDFIATVSGKAIDSPILTLVIFGSKLYTRKGGQRSTESGVVDYSYHNPQTK